MIFIVVKFDVRPELADRWPELVSGFTEATRGEPGNLWFDWSRSVENTNEYVLVEAFQDEEAGAAHVTSDHFARAMKELPSWITRVPDIINVQVDGSTWSQLGEVKMEGS